MCGFIHTLPTLWGWALRRLRRLLRTNAYAAMHKMACFESAAIVSECEKMTQGGRTVQNICQVRYLLQLLSAVVCAANCCRVVCAVIRQSSHGVCGSFDDRRRRLHRRRSLCQQKSHGVCLALDGLNSV